MMSAKQIKTVKDSLEWSSACSAYMTLSIWFSWIKTVEGRSLNPCCSQLMTFDTKSKDLAIDWKLSIFFFLRK